jgi:hypothetical protein
MTWTQNFIIVGYFALFTGSAIAMVWWQRHQRKTRLPFVEDLKLLRAPGETQLMLVREFYEDGVIKMFLAAGAPAMVGALFLLGTAKLPKELQIVGLVFTVIAFIATFILATRWFSGKAREIGNRYLGYFGERIVAEHLEPLKQQGWRIFHDVPGVENGHKFNIDHVAIGATGVYVIETKTRRKGKARPGVDDYKVLFAGRNLVWPWGEDNHGLEQAERNAMWLAKTLGTEMGERVHVTPFLTLPGWWVESKPSRDARLCRVVNSKGLAAFLSNGPVVLDQRQIEIVAAKLEARCRDVKY